jgi:cytochrome b pre-mRNA-processing protein 3
MSSSILSRMFKPKAGREQYRALYDEIVRQGRDPAWYIEGGVPDTIDGRFDMIAAILALLLLRLEREGASTSQVSVWITETFIEDMEGCIRQIGIGDLKVGKHVGNMVGALGGRLTAFRTANEAGTGFETSVRRNIFHDSVPANAKLAFVQARLERFQADLAGTSVETLLAGKMPRP